MGRKDGRRPRPEEAYVERRCGKPLDVQHFGSPSGESRHPDRVLEQPKWKPERGAPEQPRAERVEELASPVPLLRRGLAEPEARGRQLDLRACTREGRRELVVVLRREGGRIGQENAHGGLD